MPASRQRARGMAVTVGRLRARGTRCGFFLLVHNTVRGAAGGSRAQRRAGLEKNILPGVNDMSKVMKFGGGCLRDGRSFAQACAIIAGQKRVAVVVSAVSGVTELLLAAIEQARRGEKHIPAILERLAEKHQAIIAELRLGRRAENSACEKRSPPNWSRCGGC